MQASRCILWQLTFDLRGISSCDPRVAIFQSLNQPWAGHVEVMPRFGGQNLGQTESSREQPHLQICRKGYTVIPGYTCVIGELRFRPSVPFCSARIGTKRLPRLAGLRGRWC